MCIRDSAIGDYREIGPVAMDADIAETDRRAVTGRFVDARPRAIAFLVEIARHIERDRFDKDDDALFLAREPDAFAEHRDGIAAI